MANRPRRRLTFGWNMNKTYYCHVAVSHPMRGCGQSGFRAYRRQSGSNSTRTADKSHRSAPRHQHTRSHARKFNRRILEDPWLIPKPRRRCDGRGRPWKSRRPVMNGILWALRTGASWADLPDRYPSFQTCHGRFQHWVRSGVMTRIMAALAYELTARRAIDLREAFIDARGVSGAGAWSGPFRRASARSWARCAP